jgi:TolA-binding protein
MPKKVSIYIFFILVIYACLPAQEIDSRAFSEDEQLMRVGVGAFKDGLYDIAERHFSNFIKYYPKHEKIYDIYYLLGRTLLIRGKFKEAKIEFSKIMNEGNTFAYVDYTFLAIAEVEIRLGNREEAAKLLLSIMSKFPKFEQIDYSYYLLGLLQLASNQLSTAEATFKKIPQYSKSTQLIQSSSFWLGILSFKQKQFETAFQYFKSIREDPKYASPEYLKYALFWQGETELKLGKFAEAKSDYQAFCERFRNDPLVPEAYWRMGFCEYQSGDIRSSIETFQLFRNQFKDSPLLVCTHYLLGKIFLMNGDHLSSIKELNLILNSSQRETWGGTTLLTLYWNYILLGEMEGANRIFQRLQKLNHFQDEKTFIQWLNAELFFNNGEITDSLPYYFNIINTKFREKALLQIGKGYFFENKFREAITNLDILALEFPNSQYLEEGLFIKAECLVKLGNLNQAAETYSLIVRQNKNNLWQLYALTQLGTIYAFRNEHDKAENAFKMALEGFPKDVLFYNAALQLGNLNFKKKNIVEAIHYYSIVLKGNILDLFGEAYFGLGEIFYQQGKYEKALNSFETAIQYLKETSSWFFLTHLEIGNLKRRWGKYDEAKKSYLVILNQSKVEEMRKAARECLNRMESR